VLAAVLVRLFTVWLTAGLGAIGCWRLGWPGLTLPGSPFGQEKTHFDALAPAYAEQLSTTARERVVARKVALTVRALRDAGIGPGARILDAGCGHGWYVAALAGAGYRVSGIDLSPGQIAVARAGAPAGATPDPPGVAGAQSSSPPAAPPSSPRRLDPAGRVEGYAAASVLAIPCPGGTFDAALAVNVLHHAGDRATQERAVAEMARVVRPGGLVLVHEISTVNPLYRLYMTYLFPLWKRIDLGTEFWLDPRRPPASASLVLTDVLHYTFLPDFTPRALYRYLEPVERWLEGSRWAPYSAHFTATYHRRPPGAPADLAGADLAGAADLPNATDLANARGTRPPARRSRDGNGISPYIAGVSASPLEGQPR
jgi:SAM-dependent methyltransferase